MGRRVGSEGAPKWWSRSAETFVCLVILLLAAAASFNGFYDKWGFREGSPRFSPEMMLGEHAYRPFIYRQFNIVVANAVDEATPLQVKTAFQQRALVGADVSRFGPDRIVTADPDWFWRYSVLYYLTFAEWLGAVAVLTLVGARYAGWAAATAASTVFALLFPVLESQGGYFYDCPEILFFAGALYCAARGWIIALAAVAFVGVTNKETMVFFLPTLLPFLAARVRPLRAVATLAALTVGAGVIYVLISRQFAGNPGEQAEFHLLDNLKFYVNPMHLLASEKTYGLPLFRAYSVVGVAFLLIVGVVGWRHAPKLVRGHVLLALIVNLPLFAALAFRAELRNLSLTFVGWTLLLACALRAWMTDPRYSGPVTPAEAR